MTGHPHAPIQDHAPVSATRLNVRILQIGILVLVLISCVAFFLVALNFKDKQNELDQTTEKRTELLVGSRVEVISTWLTGLTAHGNRIIQSDVFRLYATEIDLIEEDVSILVNRHLYQELPQGDPYASLSEQLPMMENLLKEFVVYSGFLSGRVINRNGQAYIATNATTVPLSDRQKALVQSTFSAKKAQFAPLRSGTNGMVLDFFLPILPPEGATEEPGKPVAVLMLSKIVTQKMSELLSRSPLARESERIRLMQANGEIFQEIVPWESDDLVKVERIEFDTSSSMPFGTRDSLGGTGRVYSAALKVPGLDWWVVQETDFLKANQPLNEYKRTLIIMVILILVALALLLGAAWWRIIGVENRRIADGFKKLAEQIEGQHQFLESINSKMTDYIGYKDKNGIYEYANPAFAGAVGCDVGKIIGSDDRAVFGYDTAKRLQTSDEHVLKTKEPITIHEKIYLLSKLHHLLITKIPFKDAQGEVAGIVSVSTDITHLMEIQEKKEHTIRLTVDAFIKTIEMQDPYLAGHSRMMSEFSKALAKKLNADDQLQATVELAAFLSQIGKVFVDHSILAKPGQWTEEERHEVKKHVKRADEILKDIQFELPVSETIYQMNEKIDGSGYPQGLKDDEMLFSAKILAVANRFCAMIKPRSYRSALSPEEALSMLEKEDIKYSKDVVSALKSIMSSSEGDKLFQRF